LKEKRRTIYCNCPPAYVFFHNRDVDEVADVGQWSCCKRDESESVSRVAMFAIRIFPLTSSLHARGRWCNVEYSNVLIQKLTTRIIGFQRTVSLMSAMRLIRFLLSDFEGNLNIQLFIQSDCPCYSSLMNLNYNVFSSFSAAVPFSHLTSPRRRINTKFFRSISLLLRSENGATSQVFWNGALPVPLHLSKYPGRVFPGPVQLVLNSKRLGRLEPHGTEELPGPEFGI